MSRDLNKNHEKSGESEGLENAAEKEHSYSFTLFCQYSIIMEYSDGGDLF